MKTINSMNRWNGFLPERRYALFSDILRGDYITVITDANILTAPSWHGFVKWIGGIRPSETRKIK
jgi:hypothetical protein